MSPGAVEAEGGTSTRLRCTTGTWPEGPRRARPKTGLLIPEARHCSSPGPSVQYGDPSCLDGPAEDPSIQLSGDTGPTRSPPVPDVPCAQQTLRGQTADAPVCPAAGETLPGT